MSETDIIKPRARRTKKTEDAPAEPISTKFKNRLDETGPINYDNLRDTLPVLDEKKSDYTPAVLDGFDVKDVTTPKTAITEAAEEAEELTKKLDKLVRVSDEQCRNLVSLKSQIQSVKITSDEQEAILIETGVILARLGKALDAERVKKVDPLNKEVKTINDFYKKQITALDDVKEDVRKCVTVWRDEKARLVREAQKKLDDFMAAERAKELEAAKKAGQPAAPEFGLNVSVAPPPANTTKSDTGAAVGIKRWVFKVIDESKVPKEYWIIDTSKIGQAVRGGVHEIPGVEIKQEENLSFR